MRAIWNGTKGNGGSRWALLAGTALAVALASATALADDDDDDDDDDAVVVAEAVMLGCSDPGISGRAVLVEEESDEGVKRVKVTLKMRGLAEGKHAVHIHETAACEPCSAAGGHFDPGPFGMTNPDANHPFHSGDLVNIEAKGKKGKGKLKTETTRVTLSPGPLSVFDGDGSAIIVHVNADTYCPDGPMPGCAGGGRVACGIVQPSVW